jgi:hypothetical protein
VRSLTEHAAITLATHAYTVHDDSGRDRWRIAGGSLEDR